MVFIGFMVLIIMFGVGTIADHTKDILQELRKIEYNTRKEVENG